MTVRKSHKCHVHGCLNYASQMSDHDSGERIRFHYFPRNVEQCTKWVMACRRKDLSYTDVHYLVGCRSRGICSKHFESRMYNNPKDWLISSLRHDAFPTLNLPNKPKEPTSLTLPVEPYLEPTSSVAIEAQIKHEPSYSPPMMTPTTCVNVKTSSRVKVECHSVKSEVIDPEFAENIGHTNLEEQKSRELIRENKRLKKFLTVAHRTNLRLSFQCNRLRLRLMKTARSSMKCNRCAAKYHRNTTPNCLSKRK